MSEAISKRALRIAWIGTPAAGGGVGGFCRELLSGLIQEEVEITLFATCSRDEVIKLLGKPTDNVKVIPHLIEWKWDRWYSRSPLSVFVSSMWSRRRRYARIVKSLLVENGKKPFDVILQFSQSEMFEMRNHVTTLPPIVIFPCVHAAGELRFHKAERGLALKSESIFRHYAIRLNLIYRAYLQRSDYKLAQGVIGMSNRFNQWVQNDYGVDPAKQAVIYQPLDPVRHPDAQNTEPTSGQVKLIYVGRISVRKGIEMLVELSHRLADLGGVVSLEIIGGPSFWSDYSSLLKELNPSVARYLGPLPHPEILERMAVSDVLLVPSHYEPGGIVVAEALSRGCSVVASDEVGSAENLNEPSCFHFNAGDMNGFERMTRSSIQSVLSDRALIRKQAFAAASEKFSSVAANQSLVRVLKIASENGFIGNVTDPTV